MVLVQAQSGLVLVLLKAQKSFKDKNKFQIGKYKNVSDKSSNPIIDQV